MKKIVTLFALFALTFTGLSEPVSAPQTVGLVSVIPAATRTNLATPLLIDCGKQSAVAIQVDIKAATVASSNLVYYFAPSVDRLTYDTNYLFTFTATPQGGLWGTNTYTTNFTVNGYRGLYLVGVSNGHPTVAVTNVLKYGIKIP